MANYLFSHLYVSGHWEQQYEVETDENGIIIYAGTSRVNSNAVQFGPAIPGLVNAHSHAFQYTMAGLTESFSHKKDDFWSWRKTMYELALNMNPEILESIAAMLYSEMLTNGYTHVVEFHYLHQQQNGKPFDSLSIMGESLLRAADKVGIGITLVPIYYNRGGFGKDSTNEQRRFICSDLLQYRRLLESSQDALAHYPNFKLGYGAHSLRAVNEQDINGLINDFSDFGPFHIHISEQLLEIQDCIEYYGTRPVQWFSDQGGLSGNTHLVHATHLSEHEVKLLSHSAANVILCPSTEGNLGDGVFPLDRFVKENGKFCIGSDSHIGLNPMEELRWLDYQNRLKTNLRNGLQLEGSVGQFLWNQCSRNGNSAAGIDLEPIIGNVLNLIILDESHPLVAETSPEFLMDSLIYTGDRSIFKEIISQGRRTVEKGRHSQHDELRSDWAKAMKSLRVRL